MAAANSLSVKFGIWTNLVTVCDSIIETLHKLPLTRACLAADFNASETFLSSSGESETMPPEGVGKLKAEVKSLLRPWFFTCTTLIKDLPISRPNGRAAIILVYAARAGSLKR